MDQAEDQTDHGRLSLAGGAHQRDDLAGSGAEIRIPDDLLILQIGKVHILETHLKAVLRQSPQFVALRDMPFLRQLDQLTDPVGRNGACQEARDDPDHALEGIGQAGALLQKQGHRAVGDLVRPEQIEAVAKGRVLDDHAQDRHEDVGFDGEHVIVQADFFELLHKTRFHLQKRSLSGKHCRLYICPFYRYILYILRSECSFPRIYPQGW